MPRPASHRLGRFAEWAALVLLVVKGYRPRHRNWSGGGGELDLVMSRGRTIVFVEVKARRHADLYGGAGGALDSDKQKRIVRASSSYLSRFNLWDHPCRFDLVTVERSGTLLRWRIRHWPDAFQPNLGRRM